MPYVTTSDTPAVSIVIPARDAAATIADQIESVLKQQTSFGFELIVVDSASRDSTFQTIESFPDVLLLKSDRPGANRARNIGIAAARASLILLTDADDMTQEGWVQALSDALQVADYVGGPVETVTLNDPITRDRWGFTDEVRYIDSVKPFPAPIGCNCGFHRGVWSELGGFDESLRGANDEYEFFWRAAAAGYRYQRVDTAVVSYRLRPGRRSVVSREFQQGRAEVRTYRVSHALGHQPDTRAAAARTVLWAIREIITGVSKRRRRWQAIRVLARRAGRAVESFASHTLFP